LAMITGRSGFLRNGVALRDHGAKLSTGMSWTSSRPLPAAKPSNCRHSGICQNTAPANFPVSCTHGQMRRV
jgi:hypothetical protein